MKSLGDARTREGETPLGPCGIQKSPARARTPRAARAFHSPEHERDLGAVLKTPRSFSKYRNVKVEVDGIVFHSKREAKRWGELKLLERAGKIDRLQRQVPFKLTVNYQLIGTYIADFVYYELKDGQATRRIVEDVKGMKTGVYLLKKKLMRAIHSVDVFET